MNKPEPTDLITSDAPDFITRYFFRRLALAHLNSDSSSVQYNSALADTIAVFVAFPAVGLSSFILILSFRWAPTTIAERFRLSPWGWIVAIVVISMLVGHWVLNKRLKRYREDRTAYLRFATDLDRRIAMWQRFIVFAVCGMVVPLLALFVTYGTHVITKAFD